MQHWWDDFSRWAGGDLGHWVGAVVLIAVGWIGRNFPIRSGIVALTERFNAFEQRYERDKQQQDQRDKAAAASQQLLATELAVHRERVDAKLAAILHQLTEPRPHRRTDE